MRKLFPPQNLWRAAKLDDIAAIDRLAKAGFDVNEKRNPQDSDQGEAPLHFAARHNRSAAVTRLLALGAKPDQRDNSRRTPLMEAAFEGSLGAIDALLQGGASINLQDPGGMTALDWAVFGNRAKAVDLFLDRGANPNQRSHKKQSAPLGLAVTAKNVRVLKRLLAAGADPKLSGGAFGPAINSAALYGLEECVDLLLAAGADPNARDDHGGSPLRSAVRGRGVNILKKLIKAGADVNAEDDRGQTPLDIAYEDKRKEMIAILKAAGARRGKGVVNSFEKEQSPSWQLQDDSSLSSKIEPWPAVAGRATLRVTISCEPELASGWSVSYRIVATQDEDAEWIRMFPAETSEDTEAVLFDADTSLVRGSWFVNFKVAGMMHDKPDILKDWSVIVG